MQIIADVSKISKTVQRNLNFILNVLWEYRIHFTQLSIVLAEKNILFSHKMVFIENEAVLLSLIMREPARASTCSYNLVNNFLIYLLPLKSSVFVVHFWNTIWHGNKAFLKSGSSNEIIPLLVIFH